jgi:hypothetical protein
MKQFQLDSSMTNMRGIFYPTGYMMLMLPTREDADRAARLLQDGGIGAESLSLLTPEIAREQLARTIGSDGIPLPSAGTEGDTVRRIVDFASKGHYGLLVHAPDGEDGDRVMELLKDVPISYGQKWRKLVIEDMAG